MFVNMGGIQQLQRQTSQRAPRYLVRILRSVKRILVISFTLFLLVLFLHQIVDSRTTIKRKSCKLTNACEEEAQAIEHAPNVFHDIGKGRTADISKTIKKTCRHKYKWTDCSVSFKAKASTASSRKVSLFLNNKDTLTFPEEGIYLVHLNQECHLVKKIAFHKHKDAGNYYNSLRNGTVLVGIAYGELGEIIHGKFGQIGTEEDEAEMGYLYPFLVKKGYEGIGNHSRIPVQGAATSWSMQVALGVPYEISTDDITYTTLVEKYKHLKPGGRFITPECDLVNRIAIIVPYRNRDHQLRVFLNNIIGFLSRQLLVDFTIILVEQAEPEIFNRAALMNVGYLEAKKLAPFQCYAFHDVDLLPEDLTNSYTCTDKPRHLVLGRDLHKYRLRYPEYFGGAIMMTGDSVEKINGFCNKFYGWGGEDDNTYLRVKEAGLEITRFPHSVATYVMLPHGRDEGNPRSGRKSPFGLKNTGNKKKKPQSDALGYEDIWQDGMKSASDGLNTANYSIVAIEERHLYTHIYVKLTSGPESTQQDDNLK